MRMAHWGMSIIVMIRGTDFIVSETSLSVGINEIFSLNVGQNLPGTEHYSLKQIKEKTAFICFDFFNIAILDKIFAQLCKIAVDSLSVSIGFYHHSFLRFCI